MAKKKCLCDFGELTEADFGMEIDLLEAMQRTDEDMEKADKLLENLSKGKKGAKTNE